MQVVEYVSTKTEKKAAEKEKDQRKSTKSKSRFSKLFGKDKNKTKTKNDKNEDNAISIESITKKVTIKLTDDNRFLSDYDIDKGSTLKYQCRLPWCQERLLWIAHLKNDLNQACLLSQLPKDLILHIMSYFVYSKSKVDNCIWVRKNKNDKWKQCIILYESFNAFQVHFLNYSRWHDTWINKYDKENISFVNPIVVPVKDFKDI